MKDSDNDIARSIGRLEGKVDLLIDLHTDTRTRVGSVEKRVWWGYGAVGVLTLLFNKGFLLSLLGR